MRALVKGVGGSVEMAGHHVRVPAALSSGGGFQSAGTCAEACVQPPTHLLITSRLSFFFFPQPFASSRLNFKDKLYLQRNWQISKKEI